jgi:hypothetical protein
MARLVRREKPTLVLARGDSIHGPMQRACRRNDVTVVRDVLPTLPPPIARDLYPELPMRAPTPALEFVATLAISAVLYAKNSPRHYAPRRKHSAEHPTRAQKAR